MRANLAYFNFCPATMVIITLDNRSYYAYPNLPSPFLHHLVLFLILELPMIYLVVVMNFMAVEFDSPLNKPKYPRLPIILTILMVINTLVYYKFQHLYLVFIGTYAAASSYHIYLVYKLIYATNAGGQVSRKLCQNSQISYLGVGFPLWLVDMFHCDWFLDNLSGHSLGMTFHVIWHFGAGYGAYLGIVSLENCRARALGLPCRLEYILGCIPYMAVDEKATKGD